MNRSPDTVRPRNSLVTIRRLREENQVVGRIHMPDNCGDFDEAEIILVGRGSACENGEFHDTSDLKPGMKVLIKAAKVSNTPQGRITEKHTLEFGTGENKFELMNQMDILAILT